MLKRFLLVSVLALGTVFAYADKGEPGKGKSPKMDMDMHMGGGMEMGMGPGMMVFAKLSGINTIMEKYNIQIQKVFLETKEKNLDFHNKMMELRDALVKLSADYEKDAAKNGKEITKVLKDMVDTQKKIHANNEAGMEKIKALNDLRKKDVDAAIAKWLGTLDSDPAKMKELVDAVNTMKMKKMDKMGDCHDDKGPQKGPGK